MIKTQAINTIRCLAADAIQSANSGHPGLPLGAAPTAYTLWADHMKHNPSNPNWVNRDRFILSAGHGSALIYSLLHLFGYDLSLEELKNFRQHGSLTPGHPEYGHTTGVEMTTGPLGQGIASAVGFAMAEKHLAAHFNRPNFPIVDHYTYTLVGDGCLMEGISYEAASLAGCLNLDKLIVFYDSNNITIEGDTQIAFTENVRERFEAQGFATFLVEDGNDISAISDTISKAKASGKPSLIEVKTIIGYGSPKQGTSSVHGEPLGTENISKMRTLFAHPDEAFFVAPEVSNHMNEIKATLASYESEWNTLFASYAETYPDLATEWAAWYNANPIDLSDLYEAYSDTSKSLATRQASFEVINKMCNRMPNIIGGSADLAPSTKTYMNNLGDFSASSYEGKNLHFGIREHAMAAIANGLALHGGLKSFCSTFFVFSDYMKNSMRLAALMNLPVTYVLTHDSIGVGEDGPTHQPIEHLAMLRSMPNMITFRPADGKETVAAWEYALNSTCGPVSIVLSRQNLPYLAKTGCDTKKGAYVIGNVAPSDADILLIATGSETHLIDQASQALAAQGISAAVISMPSMDLFEKQDKSYKDSILPPTKTKRIAVEALSSFGWHKYTGLEGIVITLDHFGESAPAPILFEKYGFTVDNIVQSATNLLK